jgi:Putative peptidoglycan binding domain
MPAPDHAPETHDRPNRRRRLLLLGALLVAGTLPLAVVTRGSGSAVSSKPGPTVEAQTRDLATTLEASGSLQRSSEHTVAYASPLPSGGSGSGSASAEPASYLPGTDSTTPSSTSPSSSTTTSSTTTSSTTTSSTTTSSTTTSSTTTSSTTTSSTTTSSTTTTSPCSAASTPSTSTPSSSTTTTTPCATTSTTTPTTTTPTTPPQPGDGSEAPPTDDGGPNDDDGDGNDDDGGGEGGEGEDGGGEGGNEVPSATLTSLLDVGATASRGTVLYTADEQPVVALIGDLPAWRTLEQGVDDGADVRQLEENLVALGYGADLDVDETFTADTAAAVEAWETDLGRAAPDGTVTIGDVVFLTAPGDVLGHEAAVGDTLDAGSPVLAIGSEQRIVVADVDASESGAWTLGSTVELEWADETTTEGTVIGTGRDVTDGQVDLIVAVGTRAGDRRSGAEATVTLVDARREGVVSVPVAAVIDDRGSPAVRVAQADSPDHVVPVETGLVADGWVEIKAGLDGGEEIRLPG